MYCTVDLTISIFQCRCLVVIYTVIAPIMVKVSHVFCVRFTAIQNFDAQKSFSVSAASLISYAPYFICSGNGFVIIQKHVELS